MFDDETESNEMKQKVSRKLRSKSTLPNYFNSCIFKGKTNFQHLQMIRVLQNDNQLPVKKMKSEDSSDEQPSNNYQKAKVETS